MHINKYTYIVLGEAKGHEGNMKKGHRIRHAVVQNAVLIPQSCPTFVTPRAVARQAPRSMGLSRQEYWSGVPFPSPGDLPYPGIEPRSPALWADTTI